MNYAIIKFTIQKIIKQPITVLVFFLLVVSVILLLTLNFSFSGDQITSLDFFGFTFDEPFLVKEIASNLLYMFFFIISFLIVLVSNRFFYEFNNDSILEIIFPKLKNKSSLVFSSITGVVLVFVVAFMTVIILANLIFIVKYSQFVYSYTTTAMFILFLIVFYIVSFSLFLTQLIDGFSASIILLIPLLFGGLISKWLEEGSVVLKILNYMFPLDNLNHSAIHALKGEGQRGIEYSVILILSVVFIYFGKSLFVRKWN